MIARLSFKLLFLIFFVVFYACSTETNNTSEVVSKQTPTQDSIEIPSPAIVKDTIFTDPFENEPDSTFISLKAYPYDYKLDIRYATTNNFTKTKLYECADCLLRKEVAIALNKITKSLKEKGLGIVLFDCYRPLSVQQKMWEIIPNPIYVANPEKGSMHNRGNAVDLSLYNLESGKLLEMGTEYDYFGKKAHHAFTNLPDRVLKNRSLLKSTMEEGGFKSITSEWWHYSYNKTVYPISTFPIPCN